MQGKVQKREALAIHDPCQEENNMTDMTDKLRAA